MRTMEEKGSGRGVIGNAGDRGPVHGSGCRQQGVATTSVNFGPFKGVGMAADHAADMQKIGLQPLAPRFASAAFRASGYGGRQIRVGLQLVQFRAVNTTKGPWAFLEHVHEVKTKTL